MYDSYHRCERECPPPDLTLAERILCLTAGQGAVTDCRISWTSMPRSERVHFAIELAIKLSRPHLLQGYSCIGLNRRAITKPRT